MLDKLTFLIHIIKLLNGFFFRIDYDCQTIVYILF